MSSRKSSPTKNSKSLGVKLVAHSYSVNPTAFLFVLILLAIVGAISGTYIAILRRRNAKLLSKVRVLEEQRKFLAETALLEKESKIRKSLGKEMGGITRNINDVNDELKKIEAKRKELSKNLDSVTDWSDLKELRK